MGLASHRPAFHFKVYCTLPHLARHSTRILYFASPCEAFHFKVYCTLPHLARGLASCWPALDCMVCCIIPRSFSLWLSLFLSSPLPCFRSLSLSLSLSPSLPLYTSLSLSLFRSLPLSLSVHNVSSHCHPLVQPSVYRVSSSASTPNHNPTQQTLHTPNGPHNICYPTIACRNLKHCEECDGEVVKVVLRRLHVLVQSFPV